MDTTRTPSPTAADSGPRLADLAAAVDCLTETQVSTLAGVKVTTLEQWRKRGIGPAYARFGTSFLYPRQPLAEFLRRRVKQPAGEINPRDVL